MKTKLLLTTLVVMAAFVVNGTAASDDDYLFQGEEEWLRVEWLRYIHSPNYPAPGGIVWVENESNGIAIRGQSDDGIGIEAVSNGSGLALQATGPSYFDGYVGIGTSDPFEALHIAGTTDIGIRLEDTDFLSYPANVSLMEEFLGPGQHAMVFGFNALDGSDNSHVFRSAGQNHLVIRGTGDVGIGTSEPDSGYKLDVEGYVQAWGYETGDITFRKDGEKLWRMFEDEDGLYLESLKTGKVFRFVLQEVEGK